MPPCWPPSPHTTPPPTPATKPCSPSRAPAICTRSSQPPFYAIRFLPGITVTYGGVRIDAFSQVLDSTGRPLGGLYAAGADAGGIYTRGYTGGLSMALAFGRIAGREAAASALSP